MGRHKLWLCGLVLAGVTGCTEPGKTTGVAAATGGAIGASLGAIVGNQTGDPAAGLAIGALAGSGTGAAIGNLFEAQEKIIRTQEEAIARQARLIENQRREIDELRRLSQDEVTFKAPAMEPMLSAPAVPAAETLTPAPARAFPAMGSASAPSQQIREASLVEPERRHQAALSRGHFGQPSVAAVQPALPGDPGSVRGAYDWQAAQQRVENTVEQPAAAAAPASDECLEADKEVQSAVRSDALADRLFHYRRALRLCPSNPAYHNGIGEVYLSLQRSSDAEYEFREALKIDPNYAPARGNLESLTSRTAVQ